MKLRDRRVGLLVLTLMLFVSLAAAQAPLRPLVMRSDETPGVPPPECAEGLADTPPPPRIAVSEIPLPEPAPADVAPPPSATLRGNLEAVQNALVRNDRPAFDENLARTRTLIENYPAGGERSAAEDVLRVYGDIARLWDAQYVSPFFGEGSPEYAAASAYPGYAEAVRRATFTDAAGNRFYPAAESRQFLATIAGQRLQRLGIRAAAPPGRVTRPERPSSGTGTITPVPTPRSTTRATGTTPRRGSTPSRPRATNRSTTRESRSPATSTTRKPATATSTPSKPKPSAPPTTAADPAPATTGVPSSPAAGDVSDVPAANADAPTSTTPTWTDTTPTDRPSATTVPDTALDTATDTAADTAFTTAAVDTATTTATTTAEPTATPKRPVLLATILILIGLGVLIVLFRASR